MQPRTCSAGLLLAAPASAGITSKRRHLGLTEAPAKCSLQALSTVCLSVTAHLMGLWWQPVCKLLVSLTFDMLAPQNVYSRGLVQPRLTD